MNRLHILVCGFVGLAVSGCGPLQAPLPARLDDEQQKAINESWDKALSPVNRFDNQSLLDILITTSAYQVGVDKLEFRSEKNFSGGVVVMEVRFERLAPERDLFTVTVQDRQGKVLRQDRYGREQIETTYRELFVESATVRQKRDQGIASPEEIRKLESYEARLKLIESAFPKLPEAKGEKGNGQQPK
jgi:hypothetical protein